MNIRILHSCPPKVDRVFSLAICICFILIIDLGKCLSEDILDETEGSTGEMSSTSWTAWSMWSKCSQNCGGGISNRTRYCATLTDSETEVDINSCKGHATEVRVCNRQNCFSGSRRQSYCMPLMNRFFHGKRYYWETFIDPRRPCKSMCHSRTGNFYLPTGDTVPDGTQCYQTGNDVCVSGKCQKVGCDGIIGSTAELDLCGVCNGEEKSCRIIRSNFTVDADLMKYGYNRIMTIPKGAFNINITELESSRNYIAMKTKSGYSLLNSHWRLSHYGFKYVLGTVMDYQRRKNSSCPAQCVYIAGPINDDIHVQLLFYRASSHFTYQFSTPLDMNGGHNHAFDMKGETPRDHHHHRHQPEHQPHQSRDKFQSRNHGYDVGARDRIETDKTVHTPVQPRPTAGRNGHNKQQSSTKRKFQYNESFMGPHHSQTHQSDTQTTTPSLQREESTRKRRVHINRHQTLDTTHSRLRHQNRKLYGRHGPNFRPRATSSSSLYNRPHRIPNRRISSQWPKSSVEANQPARHEPSVVIGAPAPTILIANSRFSYDKIRERQQPIKVENGGRHQQPSGGTSQLSLGSNSVGPSGQSTYLQSRSHFSNVIDSSKSGSNIAGENEGYSWRISGFTECSRSCGGGIEETIIVCVKDNSQVVVTHENCDQSRKPEPKVVSCNLTPCSAEWFAGPWSECSTTCGPGTQTRQVTCQQIVSPVLNVTVSAEACRGQIRNQTNRTCILQPCFYWKVENWTECSSTCGKGMRQRQVTCMNIEGRRSDERKCQDSRPARDKLCDMGSCATGWFFSDWPKKCPVDCGEGILRRNLHCAADDNSTLPDERCRKFTRPRLEKKCKASVPCGGKWFLGPWNKCNVSCGEGSKSRDVVCIKELSGAVLMVVDENNCAKEEKPESVMTCKQAEPCPPQWYMMNWSKCSKSCDLGHRTREVKCLDEERKPSLDCDHKTKPSTRESCNLQNCGMTTAAPVSGCSDLLGQCHLVVRARLCNYRYYHRICCASCRAANESRQVDTNRRTLLVTTAATLTKSFANTDLQSLTSVVSPYGTTTLATSNSTIVTITEKENTINPSSDADSTDNQS